MKALSLLLAGSSLTSWIQLEDEAFSQVSDSSFVFDDDDDVFVCVCVCECVCVREREREFDSMCRLVREWGSIW